VFTRSPDIFRGPLCPSPAALSSDFPKRFKPPNTRIPSACVVSLESEKDIDIATEKQYAANRRNAEISTGPRTEAGQRTSRMNAYRHGLSGHIDVRTPEEQEARHKFCAGIVSSLAPAEGVERQFAQSIADARTFVADPARFQLLTIYERRIHSNMTKNMKQLIEIQAIRHTVEAKEKAEPKAQRAQACWRREASMVGEWVRLFNSGNRPDDPHRQPLGCGQTCRIQQLGRCAAPGTPRRMSIFMYHR